MNKPAMLLFVAFASTLQGVAAQNLNVELVWEIGGIDGPPEVMWQGITDAVILNGSVYVVDIRDPSVRQFGIDGKFLAELGRSGEGPGEFFRPIFVTNVGDSIGVYDMGLRRWAFFDETGTHKRTFTPPHPRGRYTNLQQPLTPLYGSHLALTTWVNHKSVEYPHALIQWRDPETVDTLATFSTGNVMYSYPGTSEWHSAPWTVGAGGGFDQLGDSQAVFVDGFESTATVYRRSPQGAEVTIRQGLPGTARALTDRERQAVINRFLEVSGLDPRCGVQVPDSVPAFSDVHSGDVNTVWIRRGGSGQLLGDSEVWVRWTLSQGTFEEFQVPVGIEVLDVRDDLLLARRTGEFDEQYLQLFKVVENGPMPDNK